MDGRRLRRFAPAAAVTLVAVLTLGAVAAIFSSEPGGAPSGAEPLLRPSVIAPTTTAPEAQGRGIPPGTRLAAFYGACVVVDDGTRIDAALVDCDRLVIRAKNVTITRSQLPAVEVEVAGASVVIENSLIDGAGYSGPAVGYAEVTLRRVEVRGGQHSVLCGTNCIIEDSWLHGQGLPADAEWHNNAFLSNGGSGVVIRNSTLECDPLDNKVGGGCSGDLSLFGDFSPVSDVLIENNLFKASPGGFCVRLGEDPGSKRFGARTAGVVFRNNRFEPGRTRKCGAFGPATSVPPSTTWSGNRFVGGGTVQPS